MGRPGMTGTGTSRKPAARKNPSSGGPGYLVSGGAGAPLDSCPTKSSKNCSASYHYLVFEVNGNQVDVKVVMLPWRLRENDVHILRSCVRWPSVLQPSRKFFSKGVH